MSSLQQELMKCEDIELTVSGLQDPVPFDPFEDISIEVTGYEPCAELTVTSPRYPDITFVASQTSGLSNGDEVTIQISNAPEDAYFVSLYGGTPSRTEMTYTVDGLGEYIRTADQITPNMDAAMRSALSELISNYDLGEGHTIHITTVDYELLGYYVLYPNNEQAEEHNYVILLYKANCHTDNRDEGTEDVSVYRYIRFKNAVLYPDGTGYVDLTNSEYPNTDNFSDEGTFRTAVSSYSGYSSFEALYNACISMNLSNYTVTEQTLAEE